jgi:hypothetical protein
VKKEKGLAKFLLPFLLLGWCLFLLNEDGTSPAKFFKPFIKAFENNWVLILLTIGTLACLGVIFEKDDDEK